MTGATSGLTQVPITSSRQTTAFGSLRKRWHRWRNRVLISPEFQSRAMRLPLGRQIGQRRALALHHITAGFVYSQVLAACVEIRLFQHLGLEIIDTETLAQKTGLSETGLERLLLAAASLGLIENYNDGEWALGELGAAMLANPGVGAMVEHHQHLYRDLLSPTALLRERRSTHLSRYWPYARNEHESGGHGVYSDLMALSQLMVAEHVLKSVKPRENEHWVDVAGGSGTFGHMVLASQPNAHVTVIDLPQVAESAAQSNLDQRLHFTGGDMFSTHPPADCTTVSLIRVLHDHDDEPVAALLRHLHDCMPASSRLIVAEPMAGTPGSESIGDAYFGIYLWAMGSGRPRTITELTQMLAQAGFTSIRERPSDMPVLVRVVEATPNKA